MKSDHGGAFPTPNTEYVIQATQYAAPLDNKYYPITQYKEKYRERSHTGSLIERKGR